MNWGRQYARQYTTFEDERTRPIRDLLNAVPLMEEEQQNYLARYEDAVRLAYPALSDGTVLLPFPRLFIVASRS